MGSWWNWQAQCSACKWALDLDLADAMDIRPSDWPVELMHFLSRVNQNTSWGLINEERRLKLENCGSGFENLLVEEQETRNKRQSETNRIFWWKEEIREKKTKNVCTLIWIYLMFSIFRMPGYRRKWILSLAEASVICFFGICNKESWIISTRNHQRTQSWRVFKCYVLSETEWPLSFVFLSGRWKHLRHSLKACVVREAADIGSCPILRNCQETTISWSLRKTSVVRTVLPLSISF